MSVESKVRENFSRSKELDALINEEVQELDEMVLLRTLSQMQQLVIVLCLHKVVPMPTQKFKTFLVLVTNTVV